MIDIRSQLLQDWFVIFPCGQASLILGTLRFINYLIAGMLMDALSAASCYWANDSEKYFSTSAAF